MERHRQGAKTNQVTLDHTAYAASLRTIAHAELTSTKVEEPLGFEYTAFIDQYLEP